MFVSWNSIFAACVQNDNLDDTFRYFAATPKKNADSYNVVISGLARWRMGLSVVRNNASEERWTELINGLMENELYEEAWEVFGRMLQKNDLLRKKEKVEEGVAEVVVLVTEKVKLVEREKEGVVEEEGAGGSDHGGGVSLALNFDDDGGLPSRLLHNSNSRFWFAYGSRLTAA
ncbi:uncharacterized protein HKW66_Vig0043730 [Vigna angularis]|uniref:Pentatricopeptide repeat-containing protein n=1 Tax=Phaseolus angularis TaxID=3914 RepID=A0A8T0L208_PHAAN|nr:uncharacterized protein HKW66_Vig0043730 [Vigna angularis]